ncbi:MAG: hypothetical protein A3G41_03020 [Elusimicrobia bacterium RIFCSPLOWO2_12_FULL_59_9]|nr:MAG: hypothetical protein A3G41_03020 [Elusimicrobia bacterium RIFCSPLOWO2_12_FULL_59_9]
MVLPHFRNVKPDTDCTDSLYCLTVTGVLAIWNGLTVTRWTGFPSSLSSSEPIMKVPPGMATHAIPALSRDEAASLVFFWAQAGTAAMTTSAAIKLKRRSAAGRVFKPSDMLCPRALKTPFAQKNLSRVSN